MNGTPGRAAGIGLGLLIFTIGFMLLDTDTVAHQTPVRIALASVLVALGIGAIGAALMPNTLTINGKDVTPLGLSGTATGGAAFFVATLVFLYATGANKPDGGPGPMPGPIATTTSAVESGSPVPPVKPPSETLTERTSPPSPPNGDDPDDPQRTTRPIDPPQITGQQAMVRVRTYCSTCCPQGPQGCPNTGFGIAPTFEQAATIAVQYCIGTGGHADTCTANVEKY